MKYPATIFDQIYDAKNMPADISAEDRARMIAAMTARMLGFEPETPSGDGNGGKN